MVTNDIENDSSINEQNRYEALNDESNDINKINQGFFCFIKIGFCNLLC